MTAPADPAHLIAAGYRPYADLPPECKDGRLVLLMGADGCSYPMRWNPRGFNIIFSRSKVGIWELDGGGLTWTDEDPDGAPEWWKLLEGAA